MEERSPSSEPNSEPHPSSDAPTGVPDAIAVRRRFPGLPNQIRHARRFVARQLGDTPQVSTATLLTSELATNAVTHSASGRDGGKFEVTVSRAVNWARVEVRDLGGAEQPRAQHRDPYDASENGRGLDLVEALAGKWGTDARVDGMGRLVWFELTWEEGPAPAGS